jgi:hypothetical protein
MCGPPRLESQGPWDPVSGWAALLGMTGPRARTYVRGLDGTRWISNHSVRPHFLAAGLFCGVVNPTVAPLQRVQSSAFITLACSRKWTLSLREGRIPKKRALKEPALRVVGEEAEATTATATATAADPASVRPSLALAAAENLGALKDSLLHAAASATKPAWITVECSSCGERSRVEAPVPDVRARVSAIELLLREGLGRPATAEESHPVRLPSTRDAVKDMDWDDMQALFAATYVDEIAAVRRDGGLAAVREKLMSLSPPERQVLRETLTEPEFV